MRAQNRRGGKVQELEMNSTNRLLTPSEVADILQIHTLTVYSYIKQGRLDAVHLGRTYRILPDDLDQFIESHRKHVAAGCR